VAGGASGQDHGGGREGEGGAGGDEVAGEGAHQIPVIGPGYLARRRVHDTAICATRVDAGGELHVTVGPLTAGQASASTQSRGVASPCPPVSESWQAPYVAGPAPVPASDPHASRPGAPGRSWLPVDDQQPAAGWPGVLPGDVGTHPRQVHGRSPNMHAHPGELARTPQADIGPTPPSARPWSCKVENARPLYTPAVICLRAVP
jgi:hypothetical protein